MAKRVAVVVGVSEYADAEITQLNYAAEDARAVGACLREEYGFEVVKEVVSGGEIEPDNTAVLRVLRNLAPDLAPDDLFLFFFAGHGVHTPNDGSFLLTRNTEHAFLSSSAIAFRDLQKCFASLRARERILLVDACRNDPAAAKGDGDNLLDAAFSRDIRAVAAKTQVDGAATCVIFACSEGERAYEWPERRHGVFTYYMLEAMKGQEQSLLDDRGSLTMNSLGSYVHERVRAWSTSMGTARPQSPWMLQEGTPCVIRLGARKGTGVTSGTRMESLAIPLRDEARPSPLPQVHKCPECGVRNREEETFECRVCKRDYLCKMHFVRERKCCEACAAEQVVVAERREQGRRERERMEELQRLEGPEPGTLMCMDIGSGVSLELAWCPATTSEAWKRISGARGYFMMGSPSTETDRSSDETQHRVTLTKGFWMGRTEVTQAQWKAVMRSNPSHFRGSDLPVESVSWDDCQVFIRKLNEKLETGPAFAKATGDKNLKPGKFRLPTEAEWEYACRASTSGPYAGNPDEMGWHEGNSGNTTHAVGRKKANTWGFYDMLGNVWEWCQDRYAGDTAGSVTDPVGSVSRALRVFRGGGWNNVPGACRSAYRSRNDPGIRNNYLGFRLVFAPAQ